MINLIGESQIDLTWAVRNRLLEETIVVGWTDAPMPPEEGQFTLVETFSMSGAPIARHDELEGNSYTFVPGDFGTHPVVRVRVKSIFKGAELMLDGFESLQGHELVIRVEEGGWSLSWGRNWSGGVGAAEEQASLVPTLRSSASSAADLKNYTFPAMSLGPASAGRLIVVCVFGRVAATPLSIDSVSVGATILTNSVQVVGDTGGTAATVSGIFWGLVPEGSALDVIVVFNDEMLRCAVAVYEIPDASEAAFDTATANNTSTMSPTIDVAEGGAVIAISGLGTSGAETATWTGVLETLDAALEAANYSSAAAGQLPLEIGRTVQVVWTTTSGPVDDQSLAVVSFTP